MTDKIDRPEAMAQRIRHLELELKRAKNPANKYERTVAPTVRGKVYPNFIPLTTPLTSTSWDGDSFSTTAKTKIDLSAVFGAPAGIKAVLLEVAARDSGSAGVETRIRFSPNDTANSSAMECYLTGRANDQYNVSSGICPCNANGDIYYQITASDTNSMDVYLRIWGYWL